MTPGRAISTLLNELDEVDAGDRRHWTKLAAAALLTELPAEDRIDAMDFLVWRMQ